MNHLRAHPVFMPHIGTGKQALKGEHRGAFRETSRAKVSASLDFEVAVAGRHPNLKRCDYLIEASHLPDRLHAVEVHAFGKSALVDKKKGTQVLLRDLTPSAADKVITWNVIVKGNLPRPDTLPRFTAETKIRVRRDLDISQLKP